MRSIVLTGVLLFGAASAGMGQSFIKAAGGEGSSRVPSAGATPLPHIDFAVNYFDVTNNSPGTQCSCKGMGGAGFSASYNLFDQFALVGESDYLHSKDPLQGTSMTVAAYMGGARYTLPYAVGTMSVRGRLFVRAMAGEEHAGGGTAGPSNHTYAFASRFGGGLDLPLKPGLTIRMIDVSFQHSNFRNGTTNSQNNILMGFGVVYHPGAGSGHLSY